MPYVARAKSRAKKKRRATRRRPFKKKRSRLLGSRRFTLPNTGKTLYASPDRYPRLYEWIMNADADEE